MSQRVDVPILAALQLFDEQPGRLIGRRVAPAEQGPPDLLTVTLPAGRRITRRVEIGYGPLMEEDDVLAIPVWWQDAVHPDLFPTFDGGIELRGDERGTELWLVGSYQPPLGALGGFGDSILGRRVVLATLEKFLAGVADRLVAVAAPLAAPPGGRG